MIRLNDKKFKNKLKDTLRRKIGNLGVFLLVWGPHHAIYVHMMDRKLDGVINHLMVVILFSRLWVWVDSNGPPTCLGPSFIMTIKIVFHIIIFMLNYKPH
jgi:hypothetical protein